MTALVLALVGGGLVTALGGAVVGAALISRVYLGNHGALVRLLKRWEVKCARCKCRVMDARRPGDGRRF